jgi:putative toxin-antitoxin system antitoxin component (TIGR02293 family)
MAQVMSEPARIAQILGGEKSLGSIVRTALELEECERRGFRTAVVDALLRDSVVAPQEMYGWIIAKRTFLRRVKQRQLLSIEESNRLVRLARVYALATDTFAEEESVRHWLREPLRQFINRSPMEMLLTQTGTYLVEELLGRISHGLAA